MKKRTRSILQELNNLSMSKSNDHLIETTANNIIESAINLLNRINEQYDEVTASEMERRFLNSIRTGDPKKFKRAIDKVIESKK
jgi:predicted secreted Zn-dependent protease|tara:strand:- start:2393 stop:2644 length:252 start_codon:yes stop_codon:yes gene_type:complete